MKNTNHTFAICAYKESPYLEKCVKSLVRQSVPSNIIMTTSTPCRYIEDIARKYQIPLFVREGVSDIRDDWNFAYDQARTEWVTIAHQDDLYHADYVKGFLRSIDHYQDPILFVSDYLPIKHGRIGSRDINSKIRRILRRPLKNRRLAGKVFWKKAILSLGNSLCCPAATYRKGTLGSDLFTSDLKFNIDWDTFLKLAKMEGSFAYADYPLVYYRIHGDATSKEFIESHKREADDRIMLNKFWPRWLVSIIMVFYKRAYDTYD